jgi:hypothetical protein
MKLEELKQFCGIEETCPYLHEPFSRGDFTYATNGHIMVRVPRLPEVTAGADIVDPEKPFLQDRRGPLFDLTALSRLTYTPCENCDGAGYGDLCEECGGTGGGECPECGHAEECEACGGKGLFPLEGGKTAADGALSQTSLFFSRKGARSRSVTC